MATSTQTCIYCSGSFDPSRGEGDHSIPAALGEFDGDIRFRGACPTCNSAFSPLEEQLLRCGPESLVYRFLAPTSKRTRKRGRSRIGGAGAPPPTFFVQHDDHSELVRPLEGTLHDMECEIDQLVVVDDAGKEHHYQLHSGLTLGSLRRWFIDKGLQKPRSVRLKADERRSGHYRELLQSLWPGSPYQELEPIEPGVQRGEVQIKIEVSNHYYRAVAKIAFHYYLTRTRRGLRGDEPQFAPIREFIRNGGAPSPFFRPPGSAVAVEPQLLAGQWAHLLCANESAQVVVAYVHLFVGPQTPTQAHLVVLGRFDEMIEVPGWAWGHAFPYVHDEGSWRAGPVESIPVVDRTYSATA